MKKFKHFSILTMLFTCISFTACNDNGDLDEATITPSQEVDLGLSVNWAGWNLGATSPEESGDYYAWGETKTKDTYYWSTYSYQEEDLKDYLHSNNGIISNDKNYDVATAKWGEGWRLPTRNELKELIEGCKWTWCTYNGSIGYKVEGANGNSIFLPAAGCYNGPSLNNSGKFGLYWSGQWYDQWRDPSDENYYSDKAYCLDLGVKDENRFYDYTINAYEHKLGFCIRPVKDITK